MAKLTRKSNEQLSEKLDRLWKKALPYAIYEECDTSDMVAPEIVGHNARGARIARRVYRIGESF